MNLIDRELVINKLNELYFEMEKLISTISDETLKEELNEYCFNYWRSCILNIQGLPSIYRAELKHETSKGEKTHDL